MAVVGYQIDPGSAGLGETGMRSWIERARRGIALLAAGKMNNVATLTLTASQATTTFQHKRLAPESVVVFDPKTANAAAELYGATMYVLTANRGAESWTVTHANNAQADRTFQVLIIG